MANMDCEYEYIYENQRSSYMLSEKDIAQSVESLGWSFSALGIDFHTSVTFTFIQAATIHIHSTFARKYGFLLYIDMLISILY